MDIQGEPYTLLGEPYMPQGSPRGCLLLQHVDLTMDFQGKPYMPQGSP